MITVRLKLPLEDAEYAALLIAAENEMRSPADEVRFILRQELEHRGLLVINQQEIQADLTNEEVENAASK